MINGEYRLTHDLPELKPIKEYLKLQGRFKHLTDDAIELIQTRVEEDYMKLKAKAGVK